eukprot:NODE_2372_length_1601_cov_38.045332_g2039_i0.p1 GENE.NODE_2372_length_1601_cov_38.045332_g2039_i0~~NODE_2372_length_1601_cov_38.045332_g2039_i0.p1  ORF type:complete len:387 (+),score=71.07 NODE_2372_length_1601_cov_38.045332_g2039_i0:214-1374(+)
MRCGLPGCRGRITTPKDSATLFCTKKCNLVLHKECWVSLNQTKSGTSPSCLTPGCDGKLDKTTIVLNGPIKAMSNINKNDKSNSPNKLNKNTTNSNSNKTVLVMRADTVSLRIDDDPPKEIEVSQNRLKKVKPKPTSKQNKADKVSNGNDNSLLNDEYWPPLPSAISHPTSITTGHVDKEVIAITDPINSKDTPSVEEAKVVEELLFEPVLTPKADNQPVDICLGLHNPETDELTSDILLDGEGWKAIPSDPQWPHNRSRPISCGRWRGQSWDWMWNAPPAHHQPSAPIPDTPYSPDVGDCMMDLVTLMFGYPNSLPNSKPGLYWDYSRGPPPPPIPPSKNICPVCRQLGCQFHPLILSALSEAALNLKLNPTAKPWVPTSKPPDS